MGIDKINIWYTLEMVSLKFHLSLKFYPGLCARSLSTWIGSIVLCVVCTNTFSYNFHRNRTLSWCVFTLHRLENDQKRWSFSLKTHNIWKRSPKWKDLKTILLWWYPCHVDGPFSLKTQTVENDATTTTTATTNYSNYLDLTAGFYCFQSFSSFSWKRYENDV